MSTNAANIVIGPATLSFKRAGDSAFTDVGFTQGGVEVRMPRDYREVEADQCVGVVKMSKIKEQMFVKTKLLESTFGMLSLAWDQAKSAQANAGILGSASAAVNELVLKIVGPAPGGATRTFTLARCVSVGEAAYAYKREEESGQEVELQAIKQDGTNGSTLGRFGDVVDSGVVIITTETLADLELSAAIAVPVALVASGGTEPLVWSIVDGDLPAGLTLSEAGSLSGTPTQQGVFLFTVKVVDAEGAEGVRELQLTVGPAGA